MLREDGTGGIERTVLDGRKSKRKGNHMATSHVLHRWKEICEPIQIQANLLNTDTQHLH